MAYVGGAHFLSWSFIGFLRKPSYSASFLHWIFPLSYPYSITLYISNKYLIKAIVSSLPKPSSLRIPWIHQGWTPAEDDIREKLDDLGYGDAFFDNTTKDTIYERKNW